jgi:hypothetical protein
MKDTKSPAVLITQDSIVLLLDGKRLICHMGHPMFQRIKNRIKEKNYDGIESLFNIKETAEKNTGVVVKGNQVFYKGELLSNAISNKIIQFMREGFDNSPLVNFLNNLMENPSFNSRQQLYSFMEKNQVPITKEGNLFFFKAITSDFMDKHTNTFSNKPGTVLTIDRAQCDDNPAHHCSHGFHVGSYDFVKSFGRGDDKFVTCEVNPRDIVSVPSDNCQKVRVCEYKVVQELESDDMEVISNIVVVKDTTKNYLAQNRDSSGRFC